MSNTNDTFSNFVAKFAAKYEANESAVFQEAEALKRVSLSADVMAREASEQVANKLREDATPVVSTFDAYRTVKAASKANPTDQGLLLGSQILFTRWNQDTLGALNVSDLVTLRKELGDVFPRTAALKVIDRDLLEAGLQQMPEMLALASQVQDQDSYERVIRANLLDGNDEQSLRARTLVRALFEASDESELDNRPSLESTIGAAIQRWAQVGFGLDEESEEDIDPSEVTGEEDVMDAPAVDALEEESKVETEIATIDSPISGEAITLEMTTKESEQPGMDDGGEPDFSEGDESSDGGPLPTMDFEEPIKLSAQLLGDDDEAAVDESPIDEAAEPVLTPAAPKTTTTTMVDPTTGEEIKVTLEAVESEEDAEDVDPDALEPKVAKEQNDVYKTVSESKSKTKSNTFSQGGDRFESYTKAPKNRETPKQEAQSVKKTISDSKKRTLEKAKQNKRNPLASRQAVLEKCAEFDLTPKNLEETLLNGEDVVYNDYRIVITADDKVTLSEGQKVLKAAGISRLDEVGFNFMALVAQAVSGPVPTNVVKPKKAAAKIEAVATYTLVSDVPQGAPINARRMMASVWQVSPAAEGEMLDDGRLTIRIAAATQREVARIQRVLTDTFGVRKIEATASPFKGKAPAPKAKAGEPMKGQVAPMQTAETGTGAQKDFIEEHTNPLDKSKAKLAKKVVAQEDLDKLENLEQVDALPEGELPESDLAPMNDESGLPVDSFDESAPVDLGAGMDLGTASALQPGDAEAVAAAMSHYRNTGLLPIAMISEFKKDYSAVLEKYGDETSPARAAAEAEVFRLCTQAFDKPVVIPVDGGAAAPMPALPNAGAMPSAGAPPAAPAPMPASDPTAAAPRAASKKDYLVKYNAESEAFDLSQNNKRIASNKSLNAILADAELRALGKDAQIFVDDGSGSYEIY